MSGKNLVKIGGAINLLFVVFHLSFWSIYGWPQSLACLAVTERAIMQVLNIHTAYVLGVFAFLSMAFSGELTTTRLGRSISVAIGVFWILRAVNQAVFWGISPFVCWAIIAVCLGIAALYFTPLMYKGNVDKL